MGALGEQTPSASSSENNLYRNSILGNSAALQQTMLNFSLFQPPPVHHRTPLRQANSSNNHGTGSLEEMHRRSCSTDSTSRNSMLLQQLSSSNPDASESRLEDFIRNIKCSGYGKVITILWIKKPSSLLEKCCKKYIMHDDNFNLLSFIAFVDNNIY